MCNFKIGQKVVCTDHFLYDKDEIDAGIKHPVKNEIYTIRGIGDYEGVCFTFEEIINPICHFIDGINEMHYCYKKFRPLDYQFTEDLLAEITELAKQDELVNV